MKKIAIFASGAGSNAQKIIDHFRTSGFASVQLIVTNKAGAGVVQIAMSESIPVLQIERNRFIDTGYVAELKKFEIDFIVLAGFLWMIPRVLLQEYAHKIINIHPALLPLYGGKGMYGEAVHTAILNAKEKESGITIHYVDEKYDHGEIILQVKCSISDQETPGTLAQKIHALEHEHYPPVIEQILKTLS